MDNTAYFMGKVMEVCKKDYIPSFKDYLMVRDQTTGVIVKHYKSKSGQKIEVTDVGGTRAERRKWLRLMDGVDLVIYMTQSVLINLF